MRSTWQWCIALAVVSGCESAPAMIDAATRLDSASVCTSDEQCDDGVYCNGVERCEPADTDADASGCVAGAGPCTGECIEVERRCDGGGDCDRDGDDHDAYACGGDDCDDEDANRYPGNAEICDATHDDDCNVDTVGMRDRDADGYADQACCNVDGELEICGLDCDDASASTHRMAPETCNGIDDDCDGLVDERVTSTYFIDEDGDGYGASTPRDGATQPHSVEGCRPPLGYATTSDDCDDNPRLGASTNPAATEACDAAMRDENCDGTPNEDCMCDDDPPRSCGPPLVGAPTRCRTGMQSCIAGRWTDCAGAVYPEPNEDCDAVDDDCDGNLYNGLDCAPGSTIACTEACGLTGTRRCTADCRMGGTCDGIQSSWAWEVLPYHDCASGYPCGDNDWCIPYWNQPEGVECAVQGGPYVDLPAGQYRWEVDIVTLGAPRLRVQARRIVGDTYPPLGTEVLYAPPPTTVGDTTHRTTTLTNTFTIDPGTCARTVEILVVYRPSGAARGSIQVLATRIIRTGEVPLR